MKHPLFQCICPEISMVSVDISHMFHSKCPNALLSQDTTMIFLPLNLQLLTFTFLCNGKMTGANVAAVGAGCEPEQFHRKECLKRT